MKHIKQLILLIAVMLTLALLYACGGETEKETSALPEETPQQIETPAETPAPIPETTPTLPPADMDVTDVPETVSGELVITFDYERISGSASNQYAIWIEDMDGNYINTVFATQWTAQGGYSTRPDSIALWVDRSDIASMPDYYVDAVSGATPRAGTQSYIWDLKDIDGNTVAPGEYRFFVEGTLRWKSYVLYSGTISLGNAPMTIQAEAEYHYEGSDRYDALTSDSPENSMIGIVTAIYTPTGND